MVLTFRSQVRHYRPLLSRTTAFAAVVAFNGCIDIIVERLIVVDLLLGLVFIDEVVQYLEFDAHLEFELSDLFAQVGRYVQFVRRQPFVELFEHGLDLGGAR